MTSAAGASQFLTPAKPEIPVGGRFKHFTPLWAALLDDPFCTSVLHEGVVPLTLHEAWRNGLPVIATDLGGMAECVTHGTNGLLFPRGDSAALADAIRTLSEDRAFAARLARGRPVLPTVEAVAERVEGIYVACLAALEEERTGGETS